jgi:hypothetical protein
VQLATELVAAGADIIQTEGGTSAQPHHAGTLGLIEKAAPTLAAASEISRAVLFLSCARLVFLASRHRWRSPQAQPVWESVLPLTA